MGEVINLNKVRKARERAAAAKLARERSTRHGESKAEKARRRREEERKKRELDDKRLDR